MKQNPQPRYRNFLHHISRIQSGFSSRNSMSANKDQFAIQFALKVTFSASRSRIRLRIFDSVMHIIPSVFATERARMLTTPLSISLSDLAQVEKSERIPLVDAEDAKLQSRTNTGN